MGIISIAAFIPNEGQRDELLSVIADRLPLLRRLALATDREPILMTSTGGAIIQISEWASEDAIKKAHESPEVRTLWNRFESCSQFVSLESLPESKEMFAGFQLID